MLSTFAILALTQATTPVVDLEPTPAPGLGFGSAPRVSGEGDGVIYLAADGPWGSELYESDGTETGTRLLADTVPGALGSSPFQAIGFPDGRVFFAGNAGQGSEPFVTQPASLAPLSLGDLNPGTLSSSPSDLTLWAGEIWFFAESNGNSNRELWRSDGTQAGTWLAEDLTPGGTSATQVSDTFLEVAGGRLFIGVSGPSDRLFVKNGPDTPAVQLADFGPDGLDHDQAMALGGDLFLAATTPGLGLEPWLSDGTVIGTAQLADLQPGPESSNPEAYGIGNGRLWFSATGGGIGNELFVTDGTPLGTSLVAETVPGMAAGTVIADAWPMGDRALAVVVSQDPGTPADSLFELNATTGTATPIADLSGLAGGARFTEGMALGDEVYFVLDPPTFSAASELWLTDGTLAGTQLIAGGFVPSILFGNTTRLLGPTPTGMLFNANAADVGAEPYVHVPGTTGFALVADLSFDAETLGSDPSNLRRFREGALFTANRLDVGQELFFSDGTAAGTQLLLDFERGSSSSFYRFLGELNGMFLFLVNAAGQQASSRLFRTDGTAAGTVDLGLVPSSRQDEEISFQLGDSLLFGGQDALWRTDGTRSGTAIVFTGLGDPIREGAALGDRALFGNSPPSSTTDDEVWVTDGTAAGTGQLVELLPGPFGSLPSEFNRLGDEIVFVARSGGFGNFELWKSDGTAAGTTQIIDLVPGPGGSNPGFLTPFTGGLMFRASTPATGSELFQTDGTATGTVLVADIAAGPQGSLPFLSTGSSDRVYFNADPGTGRQLYESDGTTTTLVPLANPPTVMPSLDMIPFGSTSGILFRLEDPILGAEVFRYVPQDPVATVVADLAPGGLGSDPRDLLVVGDRILFSADDLLLGRELFTTSLSDQGGYLLEPFGQPCGSSASAAGLPVPGGPFTVTAEGGSPGTIATLFGGFDLMVTQVGTCTIWPQAPISLVSTMVDGQGQANFDLVVPAGSALIGLEFYFQALVPQSNGPLLGVFALSNPIELVVGP